MLRIPREESSSASQKSRGTASQRKTTDRRKVIKALAKNRVRHGRVTIGTDSQPHDASDLELANKGKQTGLHVAHSALWSQFKRLCTDRGGLNLFLFRCVGLVSREPGTGSLTF